MLLVDRDSRVEVARGSLVLILWSTAAQQSKDSSRTSCRYCGSGRVPPVLARIATHSGARPHAPRNIDTILMAQLRSTHAGGDSLATVSPAVSPATPPITTPPKVSEQHVPRFHFTKLLFSLAVRYFIHHNTVDGSHPLPRPDQIFGGTTLHDHARPRVRSK